MDDRQRLELIRGAGWVAELLARFDFDLLRVADGPPEPVHLAGGEPLEMVAGDAAGGAFLLVGDGPPWPVVYAGSEGEGGLVATSLGEALALVVGLPSIHDALVVSLGEDDGRVLRASLRAADDEIREDWPNLDEDRARLRAALDLPTAGGLLDGLHRAAADERYRPRNTDGDPYDPMLG